MAAGARGTPHDLTWLDPLARAPFGSDLHAVLRRFEAAWAERPRLGEALRPADEPLRVGQDPSAAFQAAALTGFELADGDALPRLRVALGLWGPHGPLPSHLTEYARDRARHAGDATLAGFADLFHHRMLLLLHRAWSRSEPAASLDRPDADFFGACVACVLGLGLASTRARDAWPDQAKLSYAGRLRAGPRNAEGLRAIVADYFELPATIEEFVGEWIELPPDARCRLGAPGANALGATAVLGQRVWSRGHAFRLVLGPLGAAALGRMLPAADFVAKVGAIVRLYTCDEWAWELALRLEPDAIEAPRLGGGARLGWTTRLGAASPGARAPAMELAIDPRDGRTRRRPRAGGGSFAGGENPDR